MGSDQQLAGLRQLPHEPIPNPGGLFRVVLEAVVPVRVVNADGEYGVAGERQLFTARRQANDAVPGGVTAGTTDDDARRDLVREEGPDKEDKATTV